MYFVIDQNTTIAMNLKSGSATVALMLLWKHKREQYKGLFRKQNDEGLPWTAWPKGKGPHTHRSHSEVPTQEDPASRSILLVREPVSRFIAACAEVNVSPDEAKLGTGHFKKQSNFVHTDLWKLTSSNMSKVAKLIGWPEEQEIPNTRTHLNGSRPDLTEDQRKKVLTYYAEDVELYQNAI